MSLKHIGRTVKNKKRVVVAYRVVPGDIDNCIVVNTDTLMAEEHDSLMKLVESHTGQSADELAEAMVRWTLPDGSNMLHTFHRTGKFLKMPQREVEMTPDTYNVINLRELVELIAQQRGVEIEDLAVKDTSGQAKKSPEKKEESPVTETAAPQSNEPLSDEDLARQYRSQADAMYKEAKRLREEAEKLAPTKRKAKKESRAEKEQTATGDS